MDVKHIQIQDLTPGLVKGVDVILPHDQSYRENYFEWKETKLTAQFNSNQISGGTLQTWKHVPLFNEAENHVDAELFYFLSGTAIMPFLDYKNGEPDVNTTQVVRIQPGTVIIIAKCKGHFVPVAEGDTPVSIVVVGPKMEAPRKNLSQPILGIA